MSKLSDKLTQFKADLSKGNLTSESLLALVNSAIKQNDQASLKVIFNDLSSNNVSQVTVISSIQPVLDYIKGIKSDKEKLELYYPLLVYLSAFEALRVKYLKEIDEFINLCENLNRYYELSQYYLIRDEKNKYPREGGDPNKLTDYVITVTIALSKAGDLANAKKWSIQEVSKHYRSQSVTPDVKKKYFEYRVSYNLLLGKFNSVSDAYFSLYNMQKDGPEALEYLRKSAVYAILSNEPNKYFQISKLLGEEKIKKLPICDLLERIGKESIITADALQEFIKQLKNEKGYSDSKLRLAILEQNIMAISRFYSSISYNRISQITGEKIEEILTHLQKLISSRTVKSLIDQPNQVVYFKPVKTEEERKDASISVFCRQMQHFTSSMPK